MQNLIIPSYKRFVKLACFAGATAAAAADDDDDDDDDDIIIFL